MVSVRQENRWRKHIHEEAGEAERRQHAAITQNLNRPPRLPLPAVAATATRAQVRGWMRNAADDYSTATELAEGANAAFDLPAGAMDDECHWVWDEAANAIPD